MTIETIKNRKDFLFASARGQKFVTGTFVLQMCKRPDEHPASPSPRYGFIVTRKMGNAVIRNRIRRRLREAVRQVGPRHAVARHDYVMIPRHRALDCDFSDLLRDMEFAFSRIPYMKNDKPTAGKPA